MWLYHRVLLCAFLFVMRLFVYSLHYCYVINFYLLGDHFICILLLIYDNIKLRLNIRLYLVIFFIEICFWFCITPSAPVSYYCFISNLPSWLFDITFIISSVSPFTFRSIGPDRISHMPFSPNSPYRLCPSHASRCLYVSLDGSCFPLLIHLIACEVYQLSFP